MLRQNPPFIMHALQDDLAYMTKHLGERLVRETIYLSNHEVLRNFVGEFVSDFRRRVAQLFEQKGGLLTVQHRKALEQADRFAQSIIGDEPTDDGTITMPRQNPPLAEHMETEELSDISALLADRLVRDVVANKDGGALTVFLGDLGVQFRAAARKISRTKLNNARAAVLNAADDFAAELERFASTSVVRRRANPPLSEHMAHDDLDEIASMLAERFASAVAGGRASGFSEFSLFIRKLSGEVFKQVESYADARISDERQARLSDLAEVAANVARHTTLPARR